MPFMFVTMLLRKCTYNLKNFFGILYLFHMDRRVTPKRWSKHSNITFAFFLIIENRYTCFAYSLPKQLFFVSIDQKQHRPIKCFCQISLHSSFRREGNYQRCAAALYQRCASALNKTRCQRCAAALNKNRYQRCAAALNKSRYQWSVAVLNKTSCQRCAAALNKK